MSPPLKIYVDMDGVLKDFITASLLTHGRTDLASDKSFPPIYNYWSEMGLSGEEFWKPIAAGGAEWWATLKMYPWAEELMQIVGEVDPNWRFCTRCAAGGSASGKIDWLGSKHKGRVAYLTNGTKRDLAGPRRVLIDDSEENCREWMEDGGYPILFPASSNRLRKEFIADPMKKFRRDFATAIKVLKG